MTAGSSTTFLPDASSPFQAFQDLMPWRVQDILLVSSLYDSFTLQEDGRLNELILGEFLELSLHQTPGLTHVSSGAEALALAKAEPRFNLILTTPQLGDMDATRLAREIRDAGLDVPVVVLAYDNLERKEFEATHDVSDIERIFLWQGNARILVAIVKYVEDKRNVAHDTAAAGVPVILLVEDNVRYYSSFLPTIYTELIRQSERLISEGVNLSHKLVRMRARPKILLTSTFEEAWALFTRYRPHLLGLISDVEFPRDGTLTREAGFELARMVRAAAPDLPILLQSSRAEFAPGARAVGAQFLKKSPRRCSRTSRPSWSRTSPSATSCSAWPTAPRWRAPPTSRASRSSCAASRPRASPITARATISRAGSGREPSSHSLTSCGRAGCRTIRPSRTCGTI